MINRLKVEIEPERFDKNILTLRITVLHDGKYTGYNQILPQNDHLYSTFDYMWRVAKEEIEKELFSQYPLARITPEKDKK